MKCSTCFNMHGPCSTCKADNVDGFFQTKDPQDRMAQHSDLKSKKCHRVNGPAESLGTTEQICAACTRKLNAEGTQLDATEPAA